MSRSKMLGFIIILAWLMFGALYLFNVGSVPFHPDETSFLYQSRDFEHLLREPLSLGWRSDQKGERDQDYRALNAPLTKYLIGAGRSLGGYGPETVERDWDWSKSWVENQSAGALPPSHLLTIARWSVAILIPAAVVLLFLAGKMLEGTFVGLVGAILLASNALIMLHTRRAMTESTLIFGICLAMYGFLRGERNPWLAGLGAAIAISSKYSALAILPAGLLAVCWNSEDPLPRLSGSGRRLAYFLLVFSIVVVLFHPIVWTAPLQAVPGMISARSELLDRQTTEVRNLAPDLVMDTYSERAMGMLSLVYFANLQFEEVGNYSKELANDVDNYLQKPWNNLGRGLVWGGISLILTLLGIIIGTLRAVQTQATPRREYAILLLMTASLIGALLLLNPLPFQRYYLPLVPLICIWIPVGLIPVWEWIKEKRRPE